MNLVWIIIIVTSLAISFGAFVLGSIAILYFFRRRKWWIRAALVCVLLVSISLLLSAWFWSAGFGPHELKDPKELAARFNLVFQFSPSPQIADIHYQLVDGPDDMGEWFRFAADFNALELLSHDLKPSNEREFRSLGGAHPSWWLPSYANNISFYIGSIRTRTAQSPWSRQTWIAYDPSTHFVYCYIHSLL